MMKLKKKTDKNCSIIEMFIILMKKVVKNIVRSKEKKMLVFFLNTVKIEIKI